MDNASETCGFQGNSDIYGLGIRLGIYLQWVSSCIFLNTRFNSLWPTSLVDVAVVFEIAIFIATVVLAADSSSSVYSVEIIPPTLIFIGDFYFVQVAAAVSYRYYNSLFSMAGLFWRYVLLFAMLSFATWYWTSGLDKFQRSPCGSYVFLFARLSIDAGGARKLLRGLTCLHLLLWAIPMSLALAHWTKHVVLLFLRNLVNNIRSFPFRDDEDKRLSLVEWAASFWQTPLEYLYHIGTEGSDRFPALQSRIFLKVRRWLLFAMPFGVVLMIVAIELTIAFNSITDVYTIKSTGQLVPFIIGVGGLWNTINGLMADYHKKKLRREDETEAEVQDDAQATESSEAEATGTETRPPQTSLLLRARKAATL